MDSFQTLIILISAATILVGFAQKIRIPYPIALVLGGTAIGFVPGLQTVSFDPNIILVVVLPPILHYASYGISFREFKKNWREIFSLALWLVIATTAIVGVIFKWLFPEFPWALAFAFGAIVSPPDSVATTTILKRFTIDRRLLTILEGESLINDASALVLYKLAITALLSGVFSFAEASVEFVKMVSGGVLVGLVFGFLMHQFARRYLDPIVAVLFSFTVPYIIFISANYLEVSGVLAVVANGLIGSYILATHHSSLRRVLGFAVWDIFIILMNCFVFILIGLQLRGFIRVIPENQIVLYTCYAFLITFAMIVIRLLWAYARSAIAYIKALTRPNKYARCPQILREATLVGWAGMRGIVSLTAALALPYTFPNGQPLQGRDEVIFITFVVILITLLLPTSTLAFLIGYMKISGQADHLGTQRMRKYLAKVAKEEIQQMHARKTISDHEFKLLAPYFALHHHMLEVSFSSRQKMSNLEAARLKVFQVQRSELLMMWERQEIDDTLFRQLEHELDAEESHVERTELK